MSSTEGAGRKQQRENLENSLGKTRKVNDSQCNKKGSICLYVISLCAYNEHIFCAVRSMFEDGLILYSKFYSTYLTFALFYSDAY